LRQSGNLSAKDRLKFAGLRVLDQQAIGLRQKFPELDQPSGASLDRAERDPMTSIKELQTRVQRASELCEVVRC
jgi:hypothetical protein